MDYHSGFLFRAGQRCVFTLRLRICYLKEGDNDYEKQIEVIANAEVVAGQLKTCAWSDVPTVRRCSIP